MKTNKKDFELFKKECQKWVDRFELGQGWEIFFNFDIKDEINARAKIYIQSISHIVTFNMSGIWHGYDKITSENIKAVAKHEVIHLLIGRVANIGSCRYITKDEEEEAVEELVRKLEYIIK